MFRLNFARLLAVLLALSLLAAACSSDDSTQDSPTTTAASTTLSTTTSTSVAPTTTTTAASTDAPPTTTTPTTTVPPPTTTVPPPTTTTKLASNDVTETASSASSSSTSSESAESSVSDETQSEVTDTLVDLETSENDAAASEDSDTEDADTVDSTDTDSESSATQDTETDSESSATQDTETAGEGVADEGSDETEDADTATDQPTCADPTPQNSNSVTSDALPIDPALRIGKLDNGLTYYLRCNNSPGGTLTVRLAVNAGSLHETEVGSGVAHFLEHMLFNGTEKYPGNELTEVLGGLGIEFGADVNAYTAYDETVYELAARADDEDEVNTVFEVLAQWAHAATIHPDDVEAERGVVRDEYRLRVETGEGMVRAAFPRLYDADTPYEGRSPIGTVEGIENITAQDLRDFYEKWYVPSNMAVVAVGDLSLDALEALVDEHFDPLPAGETPTSPNNQSPLDTKSRFDIAASPGQAYSYLSLDLRLPSHQRGTMQGERQWWMEQIIAIMAGNRLQDAYEQGLLSQTDPTHWQSFVHTHGLRYYGTNLRAEDYETALKDFWSMMLTLKEHGFDDADLARASTAIKASLEQAVKTEPSTQDSTYAARYVAHFLQGRDIGTAADRLTWVSELVDNLTPAELNTRFREILDASGLLVLGVAADPGDLPSVEELSAAVDSAEAGELPESIADAEELLAAPTPVAAVTSGEIDALEGAFEWTFANGARVMFMPSDIAENQVQFQAVSLGGWSVLELGDRNLIGRLATRAVAQSGLGDLSPAQLSRYLDGKSVSVSPFIAETNQGVTGAASSADVETMFGLMHLFFTEPRIDDQAFAEVVNVGEIVLSLSQADPDWKAGVAYLRARYGDAFDWFNPVSSQAVLDELTAEVLLEKYKQSFAGVDDLVVVVVGDVDREAIERLAQTYVGTLPGTEVASGSFVNRRSPAPAEVIREEVDLGPDSQATALEIYHEVLTDVDVSVEVALAVLQTLLNTRLVQDVREEIGATYSVRVGLSSYLTPEQGIRSLLSASGAPERIDDVEAKIFSILNEVAEGGVTESEFNNAVQVVRANFELASNATFIRALYRRVFVPDDALPTSARLLSVIAELELDDVLALAAKIYDPNKYINIVRVLSSN